MEYLFAPMEGITGAMFRRIHHRYFPGVDRYYMPFVTATHDRVLTPRDLRNVAPEENPGFAAVPQLMARDAGDFLWYARALADMGYREVNLNLGCPSGTVTAKGKGAGLLAAPEVLEPMLEEIYAKAPCAISIKTRLGMRDPEEFPRLLEIFRRFPVSLLIIHPRVREDFYRRPLRRDAFARALECYPGPVCYNGGLVTLGGIRGFQQEFPQVEQVMIGQGLLADPALVSKAKGGPGADRDRLRAFHDELYHTYLEAFHNERGTVYHMKELWSYLGRLFEGAEKPLKQIRKAAARGPYESGVACIFQLPLREDALWP